MGLFNGLPLGGDNAIGDVGANDLLGLSAGPSPAELGVEQVLQYTTQRLHDLDQSVGTMMQSIPSMDAKDNELSMISLQSTISQRSEMIQLTTQLLQNLNDAQHKILDNIGDGGHNPSNGPASHDGTGAPPQGASADHGAVADVGVLGPPSPSSDAATQPDQAQGANTDPTDGMTDAAAPADVPSGIEPTSDGDAPASSSANEDGVIDGARHPPVAEVVGQDEQGGVAATGGESGSSGESALPHLDHPVAAVDPPAGIAADPQADPASGSVGPGATAPAAEASVGAAPEQAAADGIIVVEGHPADASAPQGSDHGFWHSAALASGLEPHAGGLDMSAFGSMVRTPALTDGPSHGGHLMSSMQELQWIHEIDAGSTDATLSARDFAHHADTGAAHLAMDDMPSLAHAHQGSSIVVHHAEIL